MKPYKRYVQGGKKGLNKNNLRHQPTSLVHRDKDGKKQGCGIYLLIERKERKEIVDAVISKWLPGRYTGWLISWARKVGKWKCGSKVEKKFD